MTNKELKKLLQGYEEHFEIVFALDFFPPKKVEAYCFPEGNKLYLAIPFKDIVGLGKFKGKMSDVKKEHERVKKQWRK